MSRSTLLQSVLIVVPCLLILAGCSHEDTTQTTIPSADKGSTLGGDLDWDAWYQASLTMRYASLSDELDGTNGDSLTGSVSGYLDDFVLAVPAGAYEGLQDLEIKVPLGVKPIYQLLPHGTTFAEDVIVTLDYYRWITLGYLSAGDDCEILYMNETTEEFEPLSPAVTFTASAANSTVSFATDHFSRWVIDKGD